LGIERGERNRRDLRLADQFVGELDVALLAEGAVIDELKIRARCPDRRESRAVQQARK
jgi:hypothetical protein